MEQVQKTGFPLIGVIFLVLGVVRFVQGDSWAVWIILGVLFGGLGLFARRKRP
ncbi:MAG TPA: LPXTG cell wall anchor domain-containing protein [Brevundimonas sp.]